MRGLFKAIPRSRVDLLLQTGDYRVVVWMIQFLDGVEPGTGIKDFDRLTQGIQEGRPDEVKSDEGDDLEREKIINNLYQNITC